MKRIFETEEEIYKIFETYYNNLFPFVRNRVAKCDNLELDIVYKRNDAFRFNIFDNAVDRMFLIYDCRLSIESVYRDTPSLYKGRISKIKYLWPDIIIKEMEDSPKFCPNNPINQCVRLKDERVSVDIEKDIKLLRNLEKERNMYYQQELLQIMGQVTDT